MAGPKKKINYGPCAVTNLYSDKVLYFLCMGWAGCIVTTWS